MGNTDKEILIPFPTEQDGNFRDGAEIKTWMNGWENGFKEAQQEKSDELLTKYQEGMAKGLELSKELFTEEDMRKAIKLARENNFGSDFQKWLKNSEEEIIEQIKQSKK